jgi:hypothetical protein
MRWEGYTIHLEENVKGRRGHLEDIGIEGRIILMDLRKM